VVSDYEGSIDGNGNQSAGQSIDEKTPSTLEYDEEEDGLFEEAISEQGGQNLFLEQPHTANSVSHESPVPARLVTEVCNQPTNTNKLALKWLVVAHCRVVLLRVLPLDGIVYRLT
jgi:hypothetical protein